MLDNTVDIFLSRDLDSSLSTREKSAVDEWLNSDKLFHAIRDHPSHNGVLLAGLWGVKNYQNRDLVSELGPTEARPFPT